MAIPIRIKNVSKDYNPESFEKDMKNLEERVMNYQMHKKIREDRIDYVYIMGGLSIYYQYFKKDNMLKVTIYGLKGDHNMVEKEVRALLPEEKIGKVKKILRYVHKKLEDYI